MTKAAQDPPAAPLDGLRILDFSWSLPGPYATRMLADLGAEVVSVDLAGRPELMRTMPPLADNNSYAWHYVNDGKRRIALDRRDAGQVDALCAAIRDYDVVVEQFRPGTMRSWGLGHDRLARLHPSLIYCSITGFGQDGACSGRAGHDINYLALSGAADLVRGRDGAPAPSAIPFADLAGGALHAVIGILAALRARDLTGIGRHVDVSMTDAMWALNAFAGPAALAGAGEAPGAGLLDGGSFYGYYRSRDGRFLAVGGLEEKFVAGLFEALGRPELAERARNPDPASQAWVRQWLAEQIAQRDFDEWRRFFASRDLCVEPVLTVEEAAKHPHFRSRGGVLAGASGLPRFAPPLRLRVHEPQGGDSGE